MLCINILYLFIINFPGNLSYFYLICTNQNRSKKWLALLITDLKLTDKEIYGKRWNIGASRQGCCDPTGGSPAEAKSQSLTV
jgi:hypothetical protein